MTKNITISGFVKPGFEAVQEAFVENFERRNELGAACCVYYCGEKMVDLWGGIRDKATGDPWEENTMVLVSSATKGLAAMAMALGESRGLFDYDERISKYWPEFAQQGKDKITIRQLLAHQAGLYALDERVDTTIEADLDKLAVILARQKPAWEPGTRQAYHAITLGFYESELLRRVDPGHRSLGRFFHEEIANPLGLDFYIGLPEDIPNDRLARIQIAIPGFAALKKAPASLALAVMNPRSRIRRALWGELLEDREHVYPRNVEVPSGGGIGTARSIAKAYGIFATGGKELGLREETLKQLMAPTVPPTRGFYDEVLKLEGMEMSLGFMKPSEKIPFAHPSSFGMLGFGGSFGFADPYAKIGFAYVPNLNDLFLKDPRQDALRMAMYRSIGITNPFLWQ
ncbi:MAG: beta-lactamase family protein [Candidatus Bathyarchaeota archaeon]|nr:beta-lactamase family protein [Candidatus Bathyarchaeota archaeon]MDH5663599.1 beta-lactamase family protein [Candidatus Bathyarchaeota archaeon]